ncbi:MAG: flavodoxin family protein [Gracilibacteraceae bacterium]|jgi:multimeric flavodoxin WrbA|nr:flavodoxin family protein [Gracilibacteraceae bacterium]
MKVLLINGSPRKKGCTFTALSEVAGELTAQGLETEIFHIGNAPLRGCQACGRCRRLEKRCFYDDDPVNECLALAAQADGLVVGTPVYFAGINAALGTLLDRMFYSGSELLAYKPACGVVSCRRGGAGSAFDRLNKYFAISNMPIVPSQYWNSVHGNTPEEVRQDAEGLQVMRRLGRNMAWLVKSLAAARASVPLPEVETRVRTNFIR